MNKEEEDEIEMKEEEGGTEIKEEENNEEADISQDLNEKEEGEGKGLDKRQYEYPKFEWK